MEGQGGGLGSAGTGSWEQIPGLPPWPEDSGRHLTVLSFVFLCTTGRSQAEACHTVKAGYRALLPSSEAVTSRQAVPAFVPKRVRLGPKRDPEGRAGQPAAEPGPGKVHFRRLLPPACEQQVPLCKL